MKISTTKVIHVDFAHGNLGNKMLQYLAAISLSTHLPSFRLGGVSISEWGINLPEITQPLPRRLRYSTKKSVRLNFSDIKKRVESRNINRIELNIYSSHIANLPDVEQARKYFALARDCEGYGSEILLINIRANEILHAVHPEYTVLPVAFYKDIVNDTGLTPVFLGQLEGKSHYLDSLKAAFPDALFVESKGAVHDFSIIAKSKNILVAVSTFSWLAGWFSNADRVILPLSGFLNPLQYPQVDLIPAGDARFEYYLFPENRAVIDAEIAAAHKEIEGKWRRVTDEEMNFRRKILPDATPEPWIHRFRYRTERILRKLFLTS